MNAQSRLTSSPSGHLAKIASLNGYKGGFLYFIVFLKQLNKSATVSRNQSLFQIHTLALQFVIILKVNICKHINSK